MDDKGSKPTLEQMIADFKKTSTAAKLSATYNKIVGSAKTELGDLLDHPRLKSDGESQTLLGKLIGVVGKGREFKEKARSLFNRFF